MYIYIYIYIYKYIYNSVYLCSKVGPHSVDPLGFLRGDDSLFFWVSITINSYKNITKKIYTQAPFTFAAKYGPIP